MAILYFTRHTVSCLETNVLGDCRLHSLLPTRLPRHYDGICLGGLANNMGAIMQDREGGSDHCIGLIYRIFIADKLAEDVHKRIALPRFVEGSSSGAFSVNPGGR